MRIGRILLWLLVVLTVLAGLIVGGFIIYAEYKTREPLPEALAALQSTEAMEVSTDRWITFTPRNVSLDAGLILYPGGFVDPRAYAPVAHAIADHGYRVVIMPMPLNLAIFGAIKATEAIAAFPETKSWAIGGHSLGGTMACQYAHQNPNKVSGLALWASYPAEGNDLSSSNIAVASIYGLLMVWSVLRILSDLVLSCPQMPNLYLLRELTTPNLDGMGHKRGTSPPQ